jgi:hypothetical protein
VFVASRLIRVGARERSNERSNPRSTGPFLAGDAALTARMIGVFCRTRRRWLVRHHCSRLKVGPIFGCGLIETTTKAAGGERARARATDTYTLLKLAALVRNQGTEYTYT